MKSTFCTPIFCLLTWNIHINRLSTVNLRESEQHTLIEMKMMIVVHLVSFKCVRIFAHVFRIYPLPHSCFHLPIARSVSPSPTVRMKVMFCTSTLIDLFSLFIYLGFQTCTKFGQQKPKIAFSITTQFHATTHT